MICRLVVGEKWQKREKSVEYTTYFEFQYVSSYRAMKFPGFLNGASIMHMVVLLSAHRILQYILNEYPPSKIWSITKVSLLINAIMLIFVLFKSLNRTSSIRAQEHKTKPINLFMSKYSNLTEVITKSR